MYLSASLTHACSFKPYVPPKLEMYTVAQEKYPPTELISWLQHYARCVSHVTHPVVNNTSPNG